MFLRKTSTFGFQVQSSDPCSVLLPPSKLLPALTLPQEYVRGAVRADNLDIDKGLGLPQVGWLLITLRFVVHLASVPVQREL